MDDSLSRIECTASVVKTSSFFGTCGFIGDCARLEKKCASKIASYVCDQTLYSAPYICQKRKKGIFSKILNLCFDSIIFYGSKKYAEFNFLLIHYF